jgi:DUF4097 and DUF4098 domain-containing protein YvlB
MKQLGKSAEKSTHPISEMKQWKLAGIQQLNIDVDHADVEIVSQAGDEFSIELKGASELPNPLSIFADGGTLKIKVKNESEAVASLSHWRIGFSDIISLKLRVLVPQSFKELVRIDSGSGDVAISKLQVKDVHLNSGSGDVLVADFAADKFDVEAGSGDLKMSGTIKEIRAETGSGDIDLHSVKGDTVTIKTGSGNIRIQDIVSRRIDAETGSGDVNAHLGALEKWTARAKTGSGDITTDFNGTQKFDSSDGITVGSGSNQIEIETGSGDVSIRI